MKSNLTLGIVNKYKIPAPYNIRFGHNSKVFIKRVFLVATCKESLGKKVKTFIYGHLGFPTRRSVFSIFVDFSLFLCIEATISYCISYVIACFYWCQDGFIKIKVALLRYSIYATFIC